MSIKSLRLEKLAESEDELSLKHLVPISSDSEDLRIYSINGAAVVLHYDSEKTKVIARICSGDDFSMGLAAEELIKQGYKLVGKKR